MSLPNVIALRDLFVELAPLAREYNAKGDRTDLAIHLWWAEQLAARGVLVPSAMTQEDLFRIAVHGDLVCGYSNDDIPLVLERIAKGEA
jgi:hypothetical protein